MIEMIPVDGGDQQLAVAQPHRQRDDEQHDEAVQRDLGVAHDRKRAQFGRDRADLARRLPGRHLLVLDAAAAVARPGEQQRADDDDEQHREHVEVAAGLEDDRLLDDTDAERGRGDAREVVHPADDGGGECAHEHEHAEGAAEWECRRRRPA